MFAVVVIIAVFCSLFISAKFQSLVAGQSVWIQFFEAVLIVNVCGYISHRLAHMIPFLWKFHSVHHSSEELDWLASGRTHPLDQIFNRAVSIVPLYVMGFTKEVFGAYLIVAVAHGFFIHSNIRFNLGILRGIITTPEYHHWHHSSHDKAKNKNFAGQFPLLDILFGTYYFPAHAVPTKYGVSDKMPAGYLAQLKYPFRKLMKN